MLTHSARIMTGSRMVSHPSSTYLLHLCFIKTISAAHTVIFFVMAGTEFP